MVKESICRYRRDRFKPRVRKIPWRRKWQPIPVFMLGKSYGQRSLVDYSPWGCKELDMTERALTPTHTHTHTIKMYQCELYGYISKISCNYKNCWSISQYNAFFNAKYFSTDNAWHCQWCVVIIKADEPFAGFTTFKYTTINSPFWCL